VIGNSSTILRRRNEKEINDKRSLKRKNHGIGGVTRGERGPILRRRKEKPFKHPENQKIFNKKIQPTFEGRASKCRKSSVER